jgi:hypothetical protein
MSAALEFRNSGKQSARNNIAARSNPAIAPSARSWNFAVPNGTQITNAAMKARNRGGAIVLPMDRRSAMALEVTAQMKRVQ